MTFGGQLDADIRNLQRNYYVGQEDQPVLHTSQPDRSYGLFAQQEWNVSRNWTIFAGARFDDSKDGSPFVSPRVAAIYRPAERSSYKFLYGRAFRDPSTFERYWEPNPLLDAETIQTIEFVRERNIGQRLNMSASIYHYRLSGLIEGVPVNENTLQYRNVRDSRATGIELEVSGRVAPWLEAAGGATVQKASYSRGGELPNSPGRLVKARAAMPLLHDRLSLAVAGRYGSARKSPYGWKTKGAAVADFTATTNRLHRDFDVQFGLRNFLNRKYFDPMSEEHLIAAFPQAGRSVFVRLIWHPWER
jgi:iron complex outermembrane receptor protein